MKQCRQFKHLYRSVKRYSTDARVPDKKSPFATGTILGFTFRLFQHRDVESEDGYSAYLCIADETSEGSVWPAFYNGYEITDWYKKHTTYNMKLHKINEILLNEVAPQFGGASDPLPAVILTIEKELEKFVPSPGFTLVYPEQVVEAHLKDLLELMTLIQKHLQTATFSSAKLIEVFYNQYRYGLWRSNEEVSVSNRICDKLLESSKTTAVADQQTLFYLSDTLRNFLNAVEQYINNPNE